MVSFWLSRHFHLLLYFVVNQIKLQSPGLQLGDAAPLIGLFVAVDLLIFSM